jgi:hypothetical protein
MMPSFAIRLQGEFIFQPIRAIHVWGDNIVVLDSDDVRRRLEGCLHLVGCSPPEILA